VKRETEIEKGKKAQMFISLPATILGGLRNRPTINHLNNPSSPFISLHNPCL